MKDRVESIANKTARELYPDLVGETFAYSPGDYAPIIRSLGTVLLQVDDVDTDSDCGSGGDSRVLYREGDRYGILIFGWGSCSGCDALGRCESIEDIDRLIAMMIDGVRWGDREETLDYFRTHDWEGDYSWTRNETKQFISMALGILEGDF